MIEKHYTIKETAAILSLSFDRVWRMVKHEPGVLRLAPETKGRKPARLLYRIPESVLQRILRRNANPA